MNRRGMSTVTLIVLLCSILGVLLAIVSVVLQYRSVPAPECDTQTTTSDDYREHSSPLCQMDRQARDISLDAKCQRIGFDAVARDTCSLDGTLSYQCMNITKVCA